MSTLRHLFTDGSDDRRMRVAQQQGTVPHHVVDILIAVHVPLEGALAVGDIQGEGRRKPIVVGHARRELTQRFLVLLR